MCTIKNYRLDEFFFDFRNFFGRYFNHFKVDGAFNAPRLDGMSALLFQKFWELVRASVRRAYKYIILVYDVFGSCQRGSYYADSKV